MKYFWLVVIVATMMPVSLCKASVDPRFREVKGQDVKVLVLNTPLTSSRHREIIARARRSQVINVAYEQYTELWKKQPNDGYANLLRGISALEYRMAISNPFEKNLPIKKINELSQVALLMLKKAYSLMPKDSFIMFKYGHFIWQYGNKMSEGLSLMQDAAVLSPNDPEIHAVLGQVYANVSGNAYNPQKAMIKLNESIKLDPEFSDPHWYKIALLVNLKRFNDARVEMQVYLSLMPPNHLQDPAVKHMQAAINRSR